VFFGRELGKRSRLVSVGSWTAVLKSFLRREERSDVSGVFAPVCAMTYKAHAGRDRSDRGVTFKTAVL